MSRLEEKSALNKKPAQALAEKTGAINAAWSETRLVYPLYYFLAEHFQLEMPPVLQSELPRACPGPEELERIMGWLDAMDTRVRTNQLRQLLHSVKNIKPESLRGVILRLLRRSEKTATDRDNVDLLLATYFALCAPEDLYSCEITLVDVSHVLREVIADAEPTELEWCAPLDQILEAMKECRGLREVFTLKLLEKGRELKDAAGFMFYDPAALVAFTRFNFLLRRSFFRLLHADLRAIREGLTELERRGITTVDCHSAGLTAQEPIAHLRELSLSWRQPLPKDYAQESANQSFEQLLAIRVAVERALGIVPNEVHTQAFNAIPVVRNEESAPAKQSPAPKVPESKFPPTHTAPAQALKPPTQGPSKAPLANAPAVGPSGRPLKHPPEQPVVGSTTRPASAAVPPSALKLPIQPTAPVQPSLAANTGKSLIEGKKPAAESRPTPPVGNVPTPELEACLESIWEQLIEAPPTRGRSMSTVTLGEAKILLSAWEVNAFVSDGGQLSEDLRRAVAARGLVAIARDELKRTGDTAKLSAAVAIGRQEMNYLQKQVDQAQRMKNTEAAVNLGISARRLLSIIEESQQK